MKIGIRAALLAGLLASGLAWAGGDGTNQTLRLELDLVDGSRVIGVPKLESVPVQTSYAKMDIPLAQITTVVMGDDHETATLDLRNGDKVKGVLSLRPLDMETVFGNVKIGIEHIKTIRPFMSGDALSQGISVCVTNYQDVTQADETPAMDISVTSENPLAHDKRSICDGRRETGFAFVGPKGRITLSFPTEVRAKKIIMIGRTDTAFDVIAKGSVTLNNTVQFKINGFGNRNMIVVDNPQKQAIRTISVESIEGVNNPGINEIYFVK